jgi:hypothetical protein
MVFSAFTTASGRSMHAVRREALLRLLLPLLHALQHRKHARLGVFSSRLSQRKNFLLLRRSWHLAANFARKEVCSYEHVGKRLR